MQAIEQRDRSGIGDGRDSIWLRAVMSRDARFDGTFVYGVRSTHIYCRPSCPSRRPLASNLRVFATPVEAEAEGYRACLRCRPKEERRAGGDADLVLRACRYIQSYEPGVPSLDEVSVALEVGQKALSKAFRTVLGISPWQYADALQVERLKAGLRNGHSVTDAVYEAGYSSPSRVYERAGPWLGMTPRAYSNGGSGVRIGYAIAESVVGLVLVAATDKGVCAVHLGDDEGELERGLRAEFPSAHIERDDGGLRTWVQGVAALIDTASEPPEIPLDIRATAFQRSVWEALRRIPRGETRTYGQVAAAIGKPSAVRAVARACATNPVAIIVPCHRVVPASGDSGGYRWGASRKAALLDHERRIGVDSVR